MKLHKRYKISTILINRNRESKHRQTNKLTTQDIKSQQEQTSKLVAQDIKSQARANQNHTSSPDEHGIHPKAGTTNSAKQKEQTIKGWMKGQSHQSYAVTERLQQGLWDAVPYKGWQLLYFE
jgi:hypothetical protein